MCEQKTTTQCRRRTSAAQTGRSRCLDTRAPLSRASDKTPFFFFLATGRCARGCIGDGTWYAATGTKGDQATCCMMAGDSRFFEHRPNLSHLVLADCAKSHDTTTANILDRTEVSWTRWSVWLDLLMDLAVFECATVTDTHLATVTGV